MPDQSLEEKHCLLEVVLQNDDPIVKILWMQRNGSSVALNWGEDNGCWEVCWITTGRRFIGFSQELRGAIDQCLKSAMKTAKVSA